MKQYQQRDEPHGSSPAARIFHWHYFLNQEVMLIPMHFRMKYPGAGWFCLVLVLLTPFMSYAQPTLVTDSSEPGFRTVIPGPEYKRGSLHNFFWGKHYRKEWTTPVKVPVIDLDSFAGGLTAVEQGGGRQTRTLRLKDRNGKQYVLRSIDKDYGKALPEIVLGTFVEDLAKDQVSSAHPFASITVPDMIGVTGVYHTNPRIVFVPYTPSLGKYNETFANLLCLIEERPDDNQEDAPNFGFSEDVKGTEKMFSKIQEEYDHRVDQEAFVRARLFDIFLGDWGRHDDQWRWAEFDSGDYKIYRPIPRDRDQAYTKFDGLLINLIVGAQHIESFDYTIKHIDEYNFPARYIDRQLTNEVPKETWVRIAKELQAVLVDSVIEKSIHHLPPELFALSGEEIIAKLKQRRTDLANYASDYYDFLTKEVEVVGTLKNELFLIERLDNKRTMVSLFDLKKEGDQRQKPFYSRTFFSNETEEIRLYGLGGNDVYRVEGQRNPIKVRIIGGPEKDSLLITGQAGRLQYYDNPGNTVTGRVHEHISTDSSINAYNYKGFKYNNGSFVFMPNYTNTRGIFIETGYKYKRQQWRKEPFGWKQSLKANYSLFNNSFGGDYEGIFNQVFGQWNLLVNGRYDQKLKNYFFGLGNETEKTELIEFYRMYTREAFASAGFQRPAGKHHSVLINGFIQSIKVMNEEEHYIHEVQPLHDPSSFDSKTFAGGELGYSFLRLNDDIVPTSGFGARISASYTQNLSQKNRSFNTYSGILGFYIPFSKTISLAVRSGGTIVKGHPEFYQLAWLGGGQNLRGFHRQRFFGQSSFFDDNELRWLPTIRSHLFNGRIGLVAFLDNGRVWAREEDSNQWHFGYGGGLMLAPFNKLSVTVYYGMSKDDQLIHLRLGRFF